MVSALQSVVTVTTFALLAGVISKYFTVSVSIVDGAPLPFHPPTGDFVWL